MFFAQICGYLLGQEVEWLRGKELEKAASVEINGQWKEAPIRELLLDLSRAKRIAIFIDRRVDPSIPISVGADSITWEQLLCNIGQPYNFGFCKLEDLYYFGPSETAVCLPGLLDKIRDWLKENRSQMQVDWRKASGIGWPKLSQPGKILSKLADELEIELVDARLPFDVWPEYHSLEVSALLRAGLLTVGFEKWFMLSKSGAKLKLIEFQILNAANFKMKLTNYESAANVAERVKQQFPLVKANLTGKSLNLTGPVDILFETIHFVVSLQKSVKGKQQSEARFSLEFKGKRGALLATMAQQLATDFKYAPQDVNVLNEHIELDFVDATVGQIIEQSLDGTGLKHRIQAGRLEIYR